MFKKLGLAAVVVATTALTAVDASAATISFSAKALDFGIGVAQKLSVSQFDPSLGTLTGVNIALAAALDGALSIRNDATVTLSFLYEMVGGPTPLSNVRLTGPGGPVAVFLGDTGGPVDIDPGVTLAGLTLSDSDTNAVAVGPLAAFIGLGTIDYSALATALYSITGGDNTNSSATLADAEVTVTYTFDLPSTEVPSPATLALFGAALVGLGAIRRRA